MTKGTPSAIESVALCRGYKDGAEMLALTEMDGATIDSDDQRTWPPYKIDRTITVQKLGGSGGFAVREGDKYNEGLTFDEMLGLLASLTIPDDRACLRWMQTKEQWDAREEWFRQRKIERQTATLTP